MDQLRVVADRLISLSAAIGSIGLVIELVVIMADVVLRAFGHPIYGSHDIVTMGMVIVVFGGMALCDRRGGHIAVDLLERHFPAALNRWIDAISAFLGAVIFLALAWAVYESAKISVMLNLSTNLLLLPKAWFQWALSGFAILTAIGMALRGLELSLGTRDVRKEQVQTT